MYLRDEYLQRWLIKADNDLKVAEHEIKIDKNERVTEAICFHCQQAAEKYLKAYLVWRGVDFGKTHNMEYLVQLCAKYDRDFHDIDVGDLSFYAVEIRYPDDFYMPSLQEAKECIKIAKNIRKFIRRKIFGKGQGK